jgi:hypothetical protein
VVPWKAPHNVAEDEVEPSRARPCAVMLWKEFDETVFKLAKDKRQAMLMLTQSSRN